MPLSVAEMFEEWKNHTEEQLTPFLNDNDFSTRKPVAQALIQRIREKRAHEMRVKEIQLENALEIERLRAANKELEPRLDREEKWRWIELAGIVTAIVISVIGLFVGK